VATQKAALAERATAAAARILETGENDGDLPNFEAFSAQPKSTTPAKPTKSFKPKGK
jgi:hypothetical protein